MKPLVVYYTRTKTTKQVGERIADKLKCDFEEIIDLKDRSGAKGWLSAGKDALLKSITRISGVSKDLSEYDIIIIGTPVWAGNMAPAIRTYIKKNKHKLKRVAFFCTLHANNPSKTFNDMEESCGKPPVATARFRSKHVWDDNYSKELAVFLAKIKNRFK